MVSELNGRFPDIRELEDQAKKLRKQTALEHAGSYLDRDSTHAHPEHFEPYKQELSLPSGHSALGFSTFVTETVLSDQVLLEEEPFVVTFLAAKVIEQTFYQFFDPVDPTRIYKNLSVAKHFGTFFSPPAIAESMIRGLSRGSTSTTLVDPCVGSGVLLSAPLIFGVQDCFEKLVGFELDPLLADWSSRVLQRVATLTDYRGGIEIEVADGLERLLSTEMQGEAQSVSIIMNPPYGRLRVTKDRASNSETRFRKPNSSSIRELQGQVRDLSSSIKERFPIFREEKGVLEHSRLFFRACSELVLSGASASIITPDAWMSGRDGEMLRASLLDRKQIDRILLIKEGKNQFATVNQSTSITFLNNEHKDEFRINSLDGERDIDCPVEYETLNRTARKDRSIPKVTGHGLETFLKLGSGSKFEDVEWLRNRRGEFDQTLFKSIFINRKDGGVPLVRGDHVSRFFLKHESTEEKPSYISKADLHQALKDKPKYSDFLRPRLVGRQCSYAQQSRRLIFCRVGARHAVGNSCNYLVVDSGDLVEEENSLLLLEGLLNSSVLDWYFRIENSNNHVGNYEIDHFPFPSVDSWFSGIRKCVRSLESAKDTLAWWEDLLDAHVALAFGLDAETELLTILSDLNHQHPGRVVNMAKQLSSGVPFPDAEEGESFFNHKEPSLSELDRVVISHVGEGGNWQSIPESVPSKRLEQIRQMTAERGVVRTTYYGRLRRDQPSYTINTYFNRPGNGTHIHPVLDRTLTSREAARLQSFPDSYLFVGSEGAVRNQIGNAVPPLLAKSIGEKLALFAESKTCVDVFCGAGGLSLGLERAGWHVAAAIDNDKQALQTYSFNRPCVFEGEQRKAGRTSLYSRDLHDPNLFDSLAESLIEDLGSKGLDLLVGGPPCQGFSHAGFRQRNDVRNDLAAAYLRFAERLKPRIFLLENVEGLLTFKKGQVLRDIVRALEEMGYRVCEPVWKLHAEQYGVPQMRRRVFVIATLDSNVDLSPPAVTHKICEGRRAPKPIENLLDQALKAPTTVADAFAGLSLPVTSDVDKGLYEWLLTT